MSHGRRVALKVVVWAACLAPLAFLGWRTWTGDLGANPISTLTNTLGDWTFRLLLATLALTPLRLLLGLRWPLLLRRLLGLFTFFYATLHFAIWVVVDQFFDWPRMLADIAKRPYITVGMLALATLMPLAATSTAGMMRRLGGRAWRWLHRLVYVTGALAALHFLWLAKVGRRDQYLYAAVLVLLLGVRAWDAARRAAGHRLGGDRRRRSAVIAWLGDARRDS